MSSTDRWELPDLQRFTERIFHLFLVVIFRWFSVEFLLSNWACFCFSLGFPSQKRIQFGFSRVGKFPRKHDLSFGFSVGAPFQKDKNPVVFCLETKILWFNLKCNVKMFSGCAFDSLCFFDFFINICLFLILSFWRYLRVNSAYNANYIHDPHRNCQAQLCAQQ